MTENEQIKYWVKCYCNEYGYSDRIECVYDRIIKNKDRYKIILFDWGGVILNKGMDLLCNKILNVTAFYIHPDYRKNVKYLLKLQKIIKNVAKIEKVDYIIQGSHVNGKMNKYLEKIGWEVADLRRRV